MYLDPGFGSMLIQALIGLIAVAGSSFFLFRQKIKTFFLNRKNKGGGQAESQGEHDRR